MNEVDKEGLMDCPLTCVVRFINKNDLEIQLNDLDISNNEEIELLCIGYGTHEEFDVARDFAENEIDFDLRFEYVEGDHAFARTRAIFLAKGDFVLFPSYSFEYKFDNILAAIENARSQDVKLLILRSRNRNRIPNRPKSPKPAVFDIDSNGESYFQIFGCSLAYTVATKSLLQKICERASTESVLDNAFVVSLACCQNPAMIAGSKHNGALSRNLPSDAPKPEVEYSDNALLDSMNLILGYREFVESKSDEKLLESFRKLLASRIRTYLLQNADYVARKPILDLISNDESILSFFLYADAPDWPKATKKCFIFTKWAIKTYIKFSRIDSCASESPHTIKTAANENPHVSMIVPVYNAADYLEQTLRSALDQSYVDFEIICIDDGSTDNSLDILERLSREDARITICTQPNMGQSVARNTGMELARGEFIYFFDSDDLLEKDLLKSCMDEIDDKSLDMVLFDATTFYESSDLSEEHDAFNDYYFRKKQYIEPMSGTELMFEMHQNDEYRVSPCMYVVKKDVITSNGLRFIPGIIHEDNAFTFQLMNCAKRAAHINEPLYLRRVHGDSVMTSKKTFDNSYGYFICAKTLFCNDYKTPKEYQDIARELALRFSNSMFRNARNDLLAANDGEEGGAYALPNCDLKPYRMIVLDFVRQKRSLAEDEEKISDLKAQLDDAKQRISELRASIETTSNESASNEVKEDSRKNRKGLFSSLRSK